ncbi:MAG: hypothetical protein IH840_11345 [Candidatus Heimdallarchaeota archaeon]|nr:hypothetical protein [Candidatus Heimdallarchaeota archaeon]
MSSTTSKEKLFRQTDGSFDQTELDAQVDHDLRLSDFRKPIVNGLIGGIIFFIATILVSLFLLYILAYDWFFFNLAIVTLTEAAILFLISGVSIWFGPSIQVANLKSRLLQKSIMPTDTVTSLKIGTRRFTAGLVLLFLSI